MIKAYSLGTVVEISGVLIQCAAENDFETNGTRVDWNYKGECKLVF